MTTPTDASLETEITLRQTLLFFLLLSIFGSALAQSALKVDSEKSVISDEVYYLIPEKVAEEEEQTTEGEGTKGDSTTSGLTSSSQDSTAKSGSSVSAIGSSGVMAPPGGGGGGGSGPDPVHETYARQNIREDLTAYGVDLLGEQFDMATGSLSFNHTDVVLPGNDGLEVAIRRTVNTAQGRFNPVNEFGDWELDIPKMEMMVSSESSPYWHNDRCTDHSSPLDIYYLGTVYMVHEYWNGLKMHIPGQGVQTVLDNPTDPLKTGGNTEKSTTQYWDISCTNIGGSEGFIATSPDGIKYTFDKLRYLSATGVKKNYKVMGRKRAQMLATKVEDRFGNYVNYTYSGNNLTTISSSDGRTITLAYGTNGKISSITANGRTWTYGYTTYTGYNWDFLTSVTLPTTPPIPAQSWSFDLHEIILAEPYPGLRLTSCPTRTTETGTVTHPYGAKGTYTITETAQGRTDVPTQVNLNAPNCYEPYHMQRSFDVLSLTQKKLEGPGLVTMVWDYTYSENQGGWAGDGTNPLKTTRVDKPDGSYDVHHFDRSWSYLEGALVKTESFSPTDVLLQTVEHEYEAGPYRGLVGELFYENLAKSNTPKHQNKVTTTRGTDVFTTEYDFDTVKTSSTFSFGSPIQIDQSNNFSSFAQILDIAYLHDKTNWELARETTRKVGTEEISENIYDSNNWVWKQEQYGVVVKEFSYNTDGTMAWQKDALGNQVTLANWHRGIPELITYPDSTTHLFDVDVNGWIQESTDAKSHLTQYDYNLMGRLTEVDYPDESALTRDNKNLDLIEVTTLNDGLTGSGIAIGQWKHVKTRGDLEITTYLDALFRPVLTRSQDTTDSTLDRFSATTYDFNSQSTFKSFPSASLPITDGTDTVYDALQRVIEVEENVTPFAKTTYAYPNGNKVQVTNPRNKVTTTTYFALGSPDQSLPTLIEQPENVATTIVRNNFSEMISATQSGTSPLVSVTRNYYYDSSHRLCRQVDPETGSTAYDYNNNNQLTWYALAASGGTSACNLGSVPTGERIVHGYNSLGQLANVNYPDTSPDLSYTYDDNGNLETLSSSSASWTYDYNAVNALIEEELVTNTQTFLMNYDFDTQDRLKWMKYPSGLELTIYPNAYGEPEEVVNYADTIKYHPNGSTKTFNYGNGRTFQTIQNDRQLPKDLIIMDGSTVIADLEHSYDANANINSINNAVTPAATRSMSYDDIDRLKTASGIWGSGSYSYDALGNIKTKNEGGDTISISYDTNNRVDDVVIDPVASGPYTHSYMHDAYGNVTDNGNHTFTYNLAGNLTRSTGPTIDYYYDGHKRRVWEEGTADAYTMYGLGGTLLHKEEGGVEIDYIYAGSLLIAKKVGSNVHYLHTDLLGSPIDGKVGSTSYTENYKPWGEKLDNPTQLADDVGFTGHQSDVETGLTYMQARYYDPVVGRLMAVDPVQFNGGNPGQFGRYTYVLNNPYRYTDPDGQAAALAAAAPQVIAMCTGPQAAACAIVGTGAVLAVGGYYGAKWLRNNVFNESDSGSDDEGTTDDGESEEGESEEGEKVKEVYGSLEAAVGSVNPLDDVELEGKTKNPGLKEQGFTEKWSGTDADGVIQSGFKNPETGEWTGGHESSKNDKL